MSPSKATASTGGEAERELAELTAYLHEELPLTKVMGVDVTSWDGQSLVLTAPLAPNINHTDTAFGGSISSLGILAGWAVVQFALKARGISARLLIQKSTTEFLRPIDTEITASATLPAGEALEEFFETIKKKRRARITMESQVLSRKSVAATHVGSYVAIVY